MCHLTRAVALVGCLLATTTLSAQMTGGGAVPAASSPGEDAGPFARVLLVQYGAMTAGGTYASLPSQTGYVYYAASAITPVFQAGQGATSGHALHVNAVRYFRAGLPPMLALGLDVATSIGYMELDWKKIYEEDQLERSMGDMTWELTLGPTLAYNPVPRLILEAGLRLGVGMIGMSSVSLKDYPLSNNTTADVTDDNTTPSMGLARVISLRARYAMFVLGFETRAMTAKRENDYFIANGSRIESFQYSIDQKSTISTLTLGMAFSPSRRR